MEGKNGYFTCQPKLGSGVSPKGPGAKGFIPTLLNLRELGPTGKKVGQWGHTLRGGIGTPPCLSSHSPATVQWAAPGTIVFFSTGQINKSSSHW